MGKADTWNSGRWTRFQTTGGDTVNHEQQRRYLIRQLLSQLPYNAGIDAESMAIPGEEGDQKRLLRNLMNIRPPRPASPEFLAVQDAYLKEEARREGIVDVFRLPSCSLDSRLVLFKGDITTLKADAIVNAANSAMLGCFHPLHGCIDNIIHFKSGVQLRLYCSELMEEQGHEEEVGKAKITPAFNLPCRYILHTVGPLVYGAVTDEDRSKLASCYRSCLEQAAGNDCKSVVFCCISTGEYHFPNKEAASIAVDTVREFLRTDRKMERIIFDVFTEKDLCIYRKLLGEDRCREK